MTNFAASPQASSGVAVFLLAIGFGVWCTFFDGSPSKPADDVMEKAREAVLLHYIKHANWGPIRCERGEYEGRDMLYCHPSGNSRRGGLHVIRRNGGDPLVMPVNGTARGQMDQDTIEAVDTSRIQVRPWDGPTFDIGKAIEATL